MLFWKAFAVWSAVVTGVSVVTATVPMVTIDGSGTTNPSKCYWEVMNELMSQSKAPIRMSYRAIGSGTGQKEFVNNYNVETPAADFGSGDIPMAAALYANLTAANITMMHFPVLVGAVSFFHNIPDLVDVVLNLTGTVLAKIYAFKVTDWSDADIMELNPNLILDPAADTTIRYARRLGGSSSSSAATEYMNLAASDIWTKDLVGANPTWPADDKNVSMACSGSGGMADCVASTNYSIGYIDSGHGIDAGLREVRLQNAAGLFLTAADALANNGIEPAEAGVLEPANAEADFSGVSLVNRPGDGTWPMVLMTYLYVRKDLSYLSPDQQGLLIAFLKAMYEADYNQICTREHGFLLPNPQIQELGRSAVTALVAANPNATAWIFEGVDPLPIIGAGDYIFSTNRESAWSIVDDDDLTRAMAANNQQMASMDQVMLDLQGQVATLQSQIAEKETELANLRTMVEDMSGAKTSAGSTGTASASVTGNQQVVIGNFGDEEQSRLNTAFALSLISFLLWIIFMAFQVMLFFLKP